MLNNIKKNLKAIFRQTSYKFFFSIYGHVKGIQSAKSLKQIKIKKIKIGSSKAYRVYEIKDGSLYTDRIHDTAVMLNKKIIEGPSFQLRNRKNVKSKNNIVLKIGTPKFQSNFNGKVLSLLTGGAGNANYFHWIYDVLPKIFLVEKYINIKKINYFLFPSIDKKFQRESLDLLNIPYRKRLSSKKIRHLKCKSLIVTEHPYVIKNDPTNEITNIPLWILKSLKKNLMKDKKNLKKFPKRIYIDRSDSESNHRHLRSILNEQAIKEILIKKNFKIVRVSEYSFVDQIKLFYNAEIIVGLHGAAFANFVFCKPKTKIIEFRSNTAGPMFENLAKNNRLKYLKIESKPKKYFYNNQLGHIEVDIALFKKKLEKLVR